MNAPATRDVVMTQWTVYYNPSDYPGLYVVRPWDIVQGEPEPVPRLSEHWVCGSLEEARAIILHGDPSLYCLPRQPGDDPVIVEVWL
jgi:hypothetical protein